MTWELEGGDGTKIVYVKLRNEYGFETETISSSIILDTNPPVITIEEPAKDKLGKRSIRFSGTASDENALASVEVKVDNNGWRSVEDFNNWDHTFEGLNNGIHVLTVRAVDVAGNENFDTKEIVIKKTSGGAPGFDIMVLLIAVFLIVVIRKRYN